MNGHGAPSSDIITAWDEGAVAQLFASLGFPWYEDQIKDHGITGEILVHLDHEALKDVGIHSVGQRLAILRAVYALKVEQNVPVEEGHYVPPSDELDEDDMGAVPSRQVLSLLYERDDRIRVLELEMQRLQDSLSMLKEDVRSSKRIARSPTVTGFPHPLSQPTLARSNSKSTTQIRPSTSNAVLQSETLSVSHLPDSPRSPMDSPRLPSEANHDASHQNGAEVPRGPTSTLHPASNSGELFGIPPFTSTALTPTTPTGLHTNDPAVHASGSGLNGSSGYGQHLGASLNASTSTTGSQQGVAPSGAPPTLIVGSTSSTTSKIDKDKHDNPYRSFRVTLEDPCYKVLPAALKKYKINDDWRQYALFICYGNTERCLAYDEKPLLLFQRLKESNMNPVFMLRHMKDIKSPINIASQKHALRRDKRDAKAGTGLDRPRTADRNGVAMQPLARPTRLHHPPVLLPVGKDKEKAEEGGEEERNQLPPPSPREAPGYCISIYPYLAEREDEFDVAVGDTFVIISKTKGWWVVHRDLGPNNTSDTATRKSAWVPAGCLLETSVPPLSLPGALAPYAGQSPYNASSVPIEPSYVVSVSTPGIALMDYNHVGSDELDVKKGAILRILKRYNHWSYAIKEDGQRGWIPSWFCGRAARDAPTTPTVPSIPRTGSSNALNAFQSRPTEESSTARAGSSAIDAPPMLPPLSGFEISS